MVPAENREHLHGDLDKTVLLFNLLCLLHCVNYFLIGKEKKKRWNHKPDDGGGDRGERERKLKSPEVCKIAAGTAVITGGDNLVLTS